MSQLVVTIWKKTQRVGIQVKLQDGYWMWILSNSWSMTTSVYWWNGAGVPLVTCLYN